jgi:hypothetical protein
MKLSALLAIVLALSLASFAQTPIVSSPQYTVNLSFLTGGPYGQSSALDVSFGSQFTTNHRLQADFMTMPSASYTGYFFGDDFNLCGVSAVEKLLSTTSLSCGKFQPLLDGQVGLGRIQAGTAASVQGFGTLVGIGAGYDPTGAGKYGLIFKGGWGHFGPSLPGLSSNGFYLYSGINFGGGQSASATQAKLERMNRAAAKKMKKLQERAAKANKS